MSRNPTTPRKPTNDETHETRYYVRVLEVIVTLTGTPDEHSRRAIWENVLDRLNAGDPSDLDAVAVGEIIDLRQVIGYCHDPRHSTPCPHYLDAPCSACHDECDPAYFQRSEEA